MSMSLISACFWVLLATGVAMLPMRFQYLPGVMLLIAAPVLLVWLGLDHGWWVSGLGLAGFISMFRNPLRYFWRKAWETAA